MVTPSKTLAPNGALVDLQTGRATPPFNNYLNNLTQNVNAATAGTVTTAPGSGLFGGGAVADGISIGIAANGVTNAMIRQSAAYSVVGRAFGTDGDVADITATADDRVLARMGGVLAFWDVTLIPATVADGNYGDITVSGVGTAWAINANVVSNAKFRQSTALTVVGRSANSTGNVADIAGLASQFLGVNAAGTTLGFQTLGGDAALSGPTLTLASVIAAGGPTGSATVAPIITYDAKGRLTTVTSATITPAASSITGGAALTRVSDTNVTLTLGGTPTAALLAAASITVGWAGTLAASRGGTGVGALGDITRTNDTNVTLTLGGTPLGAVITSTSFTLGWTGTLATTRGGTGVAALGDITRVNDTNVTLTLGGTPTGAVVTSTSFTLGWTGRLAYARFVAATQKSLVGATAAGDFGEITLGTGVAITAGVLSATGSGGTVTNVSVVTANGFSGTVANPTTTPAITLSYAGAALTKTDDTNVTLTLGGTPASALLVAASLTLGWTGTLAVSRGGLGVGTITGLLQGNGTSAVTAITDSSTTGQVLRVTGASAYGWGALSLSTAAAITGTLPVGNGGTGITAFGAGVATALGVNVGSAGAFVTFNGALGTPSSGTLTSCTGLPISTGVSGLGTGVATLLATFSSANLAAALTDETGSGAAVFATNPTFADTTNSGKYLSTAAAGSANSQATSSTGSIANNGTFDFPAAQNYGLLFVQETAATGDCCVVLFSAPAGSIVILGQTGGNLFAVGSTPGKIGISFNAGVLRFENKRGGASTLNINNEKGAS